MMRRWKETVQNGSFRTDYIVCEFIHFVHISSGASASIDCLHFVSLLKFFFVSAATLMSRMLALASLRWEREEWTISTGQLVNWKQNILIRSLLVGQRMKETEKPTHIHTTEWKITKITLNYIKFQAFFSLHFLCVWLWSVFIYFAHWIASGKLVYFERTEGGSRWAIICESRRIFLQFVKMCFGLLFSFEFLWISACYLVA